MSEDFVTKDFVTDACPLIFKDFPSCFIFIFYFISIFILLTRRKATEALMHRVGNYPDLLPEMPRINLNERPEKRPSTIRQNNN